MKQCITHDAKQTRKLGEMLAQEILAGFNRKGSTKLQGSILELSRDTQRLNLLSGESNLGRAFIVCLSGELGSGKTTFTQGLLKGLKVKGPYTSPTFMIMKHYRRGTRNVKRGTQNKKTLCDMRYAIRDIYHIDAYRVNAKDILNLGWEEIIADKNNVIIVEWADWIKKIIPKGSLWIKFEWVDENERKMTFVSSRACRGI